MSVNLSIKGVPDDVAARLRARAERNRRSLQGELLAIVEQAATELALPAGETWLEATSHGPVIVRRGSKTVEQVAAEMRALFPTPPADLPRGVDIIRRDRDSR